MRIVGNWSVCGYDYTLGDIGKLLQSTNSMQRIDNLKLFHLVKKFTAFCGIQRFITVHTKAQNVSYHQTIRSTTHLTILRVFLLRSILILSSYQRLYLSSRYISLRFIHQKHVWIFLFPIRAKYPALLVFLDEIT